MGSTVLGLNQSPEVVYPTRASHYARHVRIAVEQSGQIARIVVAGELDVDSARELRKAGRHALAEPDCTRLVLDLSAVDFIDSSGIGALVELRNLAVAKQIGLELHDPSPRVVEVLRLTALDGVFTTDAG